MEGGDHHEELPEAIVQPEITEKQTSEVEEKKEESSEALTDSILDDDLVVIPSQTEVQQEESAAAAAVEQLDSAVPSEPSPPSEPEPQAAVPASEPLEPSTQTQTAPAQTQPAPAQTQPAPAQTQPAPAQTILTPVPPSQPTPEPSITIKTRPASATVRTSSKVLTKTPLAEDDDDDFEDETLTERLVGLTEMFPSTLCTVAGVTFSLSVSSMKKLFNFSRSALWIGSTSFMLLILPIVFETEMVHMEQAQIQRQKQILLGPNAATAGGMTGGLTPPMPGISVAAPPSEGR